MADLIFHGQFIDKTNLDGETGLTVTIDVYRTLIADGTTSQVVTDGSCTETGGGLYRYRYASADLSLYHYVANMKTASADVAQKHVATLGLVVPDALVSDVPADILVTPANKLATLAAGEIVISPDTVVLAYVSQIGPVAQQDIRDSAKLAPSAGDPAAGSVDAHLDDILEDTGATLPALLAGLSGTTVTVVSAVVGGTITVYAADTWRFTVASDELDLADFETVALVVKRNARQADNQALLYVRSDTGLVRMDGSAPASAGNGTLTKTASSFTAVVHVAETQGLTPGGYTWWLKGIDTTPAPDEAVTLATGEFVVLAAGLQAVV